MFERAILVMVFVALAACGDGPSKKAPFVPSNNGTSPTNTASNNATSNNAATNNTTIGNGETNNTVPGPCAELDTTQLAFGGNLVDSSVTRTITLTNCSDTEAVEVESVSVNGEGFDAIIVGESMAGPSETVQIDVTFTPFAVGEYDAILSIAHSAGNDPEIVDLTGQGTDTVCVTSVAKVRNASSGGSFGTSARATPGEVVELDGSDSSSPAGDVLFDWAIISRPSASAISLSNNSSAAPVFSPDVPGEYRIELVASDVAGNEPCNTAQVSVTVASENTGSTNISLQLVWQTPDDPTPGDDIGTDLDIHWLRESGTWNQAPFDCFWDNRMPDWGVPQDESDDPSLDIDDAAGEGPENINHSKLESGITYSVGVYYYADQAIGPSYATVRIFENNVLIFEFEDRFMGQQQDFWYVADYSTTGGVVSIDTVTSGYP